MSSYVTRKTPGDTAWFTHDRFGMFIHFGLFSMPARHEWIKQREKISEEHYDKYFEHFNPDLYDPKEWARQAKAAGMKYAVFTTKHHEGFCLFDTKYTDYNVMNTPYGKDVVKEYVEAFRAEGLRVGLYYSLIDWHHPEFPYDTIHPRLGDENSKEESDKRDMRKYAEYMRNQVTELLTNYGKIDIMWFDFSYPHYKMEGKYSWAKGKGKDDWESEKLLALARSIQPHLIIDNRTGIEQDLWTPEQYQPMNWVRHKETGELVTWEACHTFSGSWGYHRDESTWKAPEVLIGLLVNTVSRGGNLLMNVGPTARGCIDYRAEDSLKVYADWMKYHSRSIYGCTMAEPEFVEPRGCRFTQSVDGKRLYIHLCEYPYRYLELPGFAGKVDYAQLLYDGSELKMTEKAPKLIAAGEGSQSESDDLLVVELPYTKPPVLVPVVELFLK